MRRSRQPTLPRIRDGLPPRLRRLLRRILLVHADDREPVPDEREGTGSESGDGGCEVRERGVAEEGLN